MQFCSASRNSIFSSRYCYILHLVERGRVYGRVYGSSNVKWPVSNLSPLVGSGPYSGIWYGPDLSETWSHYMSGRVRSGQVGSGLVRVRVVEFGLYRAQHCNRARFIWSTSQKSWLYNFCRKAPQSKKSTRLRSESLGCNFFLFPR